MVETWKSWGHAAVNYLGLLVANVYQGRVDSETERVAAGRGSIGHRGSNRAQAGEIDQHGFTCLSGFGGSYLGIVGVENGAVPGAVTGERVDSRRCGCYRNRDGIGTGASALNHDGGGGAAGGVGNQAVDLELAAGWASEINRRGDVIDQHANAIERGGVGRRSRDTCRKKYLPLSD